MYVLELACFRAQPQHALALSRCGGPLVRALRAHFPGLRKVQLARIGDGRWLQLAFWETREDAETAADEMYDLPEMYDWLAQVDEFGEAA